jgi:DNA modification methylase
MDIQTSVIYCGDCLNKLKELPDESVDLIYIDPPFSSNRNYVAFWQEQEKRHFEDRFENVRAYIDYMTPRLKELYRVLKPTGSFYYHCDWHASHYIKVLLDRDDLFGYDNFQNEIVWCYKTGGATTKRFAKKHDILLFYSKSNKWNFNPQKEKSYMMHEYGFKKSNFQKDGKGQYSWVLDKDWWELPAVGSATKE